MVEGITLRCYTPGPLADERCNVYDLIVCERV